MHQLLQAFRACARRYNSITTFPLKIEAAFFFGWVDLPTYQITRRHPSAHINLNIQRRAKPQSRKLNNGHIHLIFKLVILTVGDLQWHDVHTENVSRSKQVISGGGDTRARTHARGHQSAIQNSIWPTTSGTFLYVTNIDI
jgi:hypothetical protein